MKIKISKISKLKNTKLSNTRSLSDNLVINEKNVIDARVLHTGRVLTIDDINENRSSKYSYLAF